MTPFNNLILISSGHDPLTCAMNISTWPSTCRPQACCLHRRVLVPVMARLSGNPWVWPPNVDLTFQTCLACGHTSLQALKKVWVPRTFMYVSHLWALFVLASCAFFLMVMTCRSACLRKKTNVGRDSESESVSRTRTCHASNFFSSFYIQSIWDLSFFGWKPRSQ